MSKNNNTSHVPVARLRCIAAAALIPLLSLAACSQSVSLKVESDVPLPVVARIPLAMGIYYEDALRNYIYTEDSEDRPKWRIESGKSQVALFDQILPSMFQSVTYVNGVPVTGTEAHLDGVLAPRVDEMQFALPTETKSELYEAWVKYSVRLYQPNGQLVAEWPVTGYGKSSEEMLKSRDAGLQAAINLALRDAGAKLALGFDQVADVRAWLAATTKDCQKYADQCQH